MKNQAIISLENKIELISNKAYEAQAKCICLPTADNIHKVAEIYQEYRKVAQELQRHIEIINFKSVIEAKELDFVLAN